MIIHTAPARITAGIIHRLSGPSRYAATAAISTSTILRTIEILFIWVSFDDRYGNGNGEWFKPRSGIRKGEGEEGEGRGTQEGLHRGLDHALIVAQIRPPPEGRPRHPP